VTQTWRLRRSKEFEEPQRLPSKTEAKAVQAGIDVPKAGLPEYLEGLVVLERHSPNASTMKPQHDFTFSNTMQSSI